MLSALALGSFVLSSFSACSSSFQVSPYGGYYLPLGDSHILYAETEEVDEDIECEVNEESIPLFTALGKEVKDKEENGTKKYYYLATKESPMISAISFTTDDVVRLRKQIEGVENTAITFQAGMGRPNPYYMDNLVLMYIRSFSKTYSYDTAGHYFGWLAAAGSLNPVFIKVADPIFIQGVQNRTFFAQYVSKDNYSEELHKRSFWEIVHNYNLTFEQSFKDPVNDSDYPTQNKSIDLLHLFASIDACYDQTYASNNVYGFGNPMADVVHDVASWAGDLQTAARILSEKKSVNYSFESIMSDSTLGCTEDDILADIDAVNITDSYLTGPGRVNDALRDYYGAVTNQHTRFSRFIDGVLNDKNSDWSGTRFQKFEQEVYDDLAIHYNPTTKTCTDYSSSVDWVDKNFKKFAILNNNTKSFPDFSARQAVGKAFIDYVEKRA